MYIHGHRYMYERQSYMYCTWTLARLQIARVVRVQDEQDDEHDWTEVLRGATGRLKVRLILNEWWRWAE